MKLFLDTKDFDSLNVTLEEEDKAAGTDKMLGDFCFATASFFSELCKKLNLDERKIEKLKPMFLEFLGNEIDVVLEQNALEDDDDNAAEELTDALSMCGLNPKDMSSLGGLGKLLAESGNMEAVLGFVSEVARKNNIDLSKIKL